MHAACKAGSIFENQSMHFTIINKLWKRNHTITSVENHWIKFNNYL